MKTLAVGLVALTRPLIVLALALVGQVLAQTAEHECCSSVILAPDHFRPDYPLAPDHWNPTKYGRRYRGPVDHPVPRQCNDDHIHFDELAEPGWESRLVPASGLHLVVWDMKPPGAGPNPDTTFQRAEIDASVGGTWRTREGCFDDIEQLGGPEDRFLARYRPPQNYVPNMAAGYPIVFRSQQSTAQLWWHSPLSQVVGVPGFLPEHIEVKHFDGTVAHYEKAGAPPVRRGPQNNSQIGTLWRLKSVKDAYDNETVYEYGQYSGIQRVRYPGGRTAEWNWDPSWASNWPGRSAIDISFSGPGGVAIGAPLRYIFDNISGVAPAALTHFAGRLHAFVAMPGPFVPEPSSGSLYDLGASETRQKVTEYTYGTSGPSDGRLVSIAHYWQQVGDPVPDPSLPRYVTDEFGYLNGKLASHFAPQIGISTTYSHGSDVPTYPGAGAIPGMSTYRTTRQDGSYTVTEFDSVKHRSYRIYTAPGPAGKPRTAEQPAGLAVTTEPDFHVVDRFYDDTCLCQKPVRVEEFSVRGSSGTPATGAIEGLRTTHFTYEAGTKLPLTVRRPNPSTSPGAPAYVVESTTYHHDGSQLWSPRWVATEDVREEGASQPYSLVEYAYPNPMARTKSWHGPMQGKIVRTVKAVRLQVSMTSQSTADVSDSVIFNVPGNPAFASGITYSGPSTGFPRGQVRSANDGDGVAEWFVYDSRGRVQATVVGAVSTGFVHDDWDRLTHVQTHTSSAGLSATWALEQTLDFRTLLEHTVNGPIAETRYHYDRWGNLAVILKKNTDAAGASPTRHGGATAARPWIRSEYLWDGPRLRESRVDRRPLDEGDSNPFGGTNPLMLVTSHDYVTDPSLGLLHRVTAANGAVTEERYDGFGTPFRVTVARDGTPGAPRIEVSRIYNDVFMEPAHVVKGPITTAGAYRATQLLRNAAGAVIEVVEPTAPGFAGYTGYLGGGRHRFDIDLLGRTFGHQVMEGSVVRGAARVGYDQLGRVMWREEDLLGPNPATHRSVTSYQAGKESWIASRQATDAPLTNYFYDAHGRTSAISRPEGVTTYGYVPGTDWVAQTSQAPAGSAQVFAVAHRYDALGREIESRQLANAGGNAVGDLVTTFEFNSLGMMERQTDPMARAQKSLHDALGRRVEHVRLGAQGAFIRNRTDFVDTGLPQGRSHMSQFDGLGHETRTSFDWAGRQFLIHNPGADVNVIPTVGSPHPHTELVSYDALSQVTSKLDGDGGLTLMDYDGMGRLIHRKLETWREAISTFNTRDILRRDIFGRIYEAGSAGSTNGNQTAQPLNHGVALLNAATAFDSLGRVKSETYAFGFVGGFFPQIQSSFSGAEGFRRGVTYAGVGATDSVNIALAPDASWRLSAVQWDRGGAGIRDLASYAWLGSLRSSRTMTIGAVSTSAVAVEAYEYDNFGRLKSIVDVTTIGTQSTTTNQFEYLYDAAGNLKQEKYAKVGGWQGDRFTYDAYHRLQKAYLGVSQALISPDPLADPAGYSSSDTKQLVEYGLDEAQNRSQVTERAVSGTTTFAYALEPSGLSNRYETAHGLKPEHDNRGNLTYDGRFYYRYDFLNRLQEVWKVVVDDVAPSAGQGNEAYVVVEETPALEESRQEVYEDVYNLLHRVPLEHHDPVFRARLRSPISGGVVPVGEASSATPGGGVPMFALPANLELVALYGYDAYNRRAIRVVIGDQTYLSSYDGWREVVEYRLDPGTGAAVPIKHFVHGGRLDEMLAYRRKNGGSWETYYLQHGGQDTAAKLLNESGQVVEQYEYDAYGKVTVYTASGQKVGDGAKSAYGLSHLWKGIRRDPETELLYMRNRYYSAETGRFVTVDPIGVHGDPANQGGEYSYCGAQPLTRWDPLGRQGENEGGWFAGALSALGDAALGLLQVAHMAMPGALATHLCTETVPGLMAGGSVVEALEACPLTAPATQLVDVAVNTYDTAGKNLLDGAERWYIAAVDGTGYEKGRLWTSAAVSLLPFLRYRAGVRIAPGPSAGPVRFLGSRGVRNAEHLTDSQWSQIGRHIDELGLDRRDFLRSSHVSAYSDLMDRVLLGPNVFPAPTSGMGGSVLNRLSPRAVVAHEAGHMLTTRAGKSFAPGSLMDEIGASLTGRRLPGLSSTERYQLLRDAAERARAEGTRLRWLVSQ